MERAFGSDWLGWQQLDSKLGTENCLPVSDISWKSTAASLRPQPWTLAHSFRQLPKACWCRLQVMTQPPFSCDETTKPTVASNLWIKPRRERGRREHLWAEPLLKRLASAAARGLDDIFKLNEKAGKKLWRLFSVAGFSFAPNRKLGLSFPNTFCGIPFFISPSTTIFSHLSPENSDSNKKIN